MKFVDEGNKVKTRLKTKRGRRLAVNKSTPLLNDKVTVHKASQERDGKKEQGTVHQLELNSLKKPSGMKAQRDQILSSFVSSMFPLDQLMFRLRFLEVGCGIYHLVWTAVRF